jgi:hypothetical protein
MEQRRFDAGRYVVPEARFKAKSCKFAECDLQLALPVAEGNLPSAEQFFNPK